LNVEVKTKGETKNPELKLIQIRVFYLYFLTSTFEIQYSTFNIDITGFSSCSCNTYRAKAWPV